MCLDLARETGYQLGMANGLGMLGAVALAEGAHAEAQRLYQEAVLIYQEIGQRDELGWSLSGLGSAALARGNIPQARQYFYGALQTAAEIRSFMTLLVMLPSVALLLAVQGETERAIVLYALMMRYPAVANSQPGHELIGQPMAAFVATLPPEAIAAAEGRGRTQDLWDVATELMAELEVRE
jgi:tetratricopeptide (TPR) repeat protein